MMRSPSLGILGGMGPQATAVFMERIITHTEAQRDQDHIDMVVLSHASLPDRTWAIKNGQGELFLEAVQADLKLMGTAGVANIAIPCNTSHYFYDDMQQMTDIPIIHMVKETIQHVYADCGPGKRIGLLATEGTIGSGVYTQEGQHRGLELVIPDEALQREVSAIIYEQVKKNGDSNPEPLSRVIEKMVTDHGCDRVIPGLHGIIVHSAVPS